MASVAHRIRCSFPASFYLIVDCSTHGRIMFQEHGKKHTMKSSMKIKRQVEELRLIKGKSHTVCKY